MEPDEARVARLAVEIGNVLTSNRASLLEGVFALCRCLTASLTLADNRVSLRQTIVALLDSELASVGLNAKSS